MASVAKARIKARIEEPRKEQQALLTRIGLKLRLKKTVVRWTEDEWDELARRVWKKRARYPEKSLATMVNEAQEQQGQPDVEPWPDDRKRVITGLAMIKPILKRLKGLDLEMHEAVAIEIPRLHDRIESIQARPDRETLLDTLLDEELVRRFGARVLDNLQPADILSHFKSAELLHSIPISDVFQFLGTSIFGRISAVELRLAEHLVEHQRHPVQVPVNGTSNGHVNPLLPRIVVLGFQQHHIPVLQSHVGGGAEVHYVPKGEMTSKFQVPPGQHVVLWRSNVSGQFSKLVHRQVDNSNLTVLEGPFADLIPSVLKIPCLKRKAK